MTDFENKDLNGQVPEAPAPQPVEAPVPEIPTEPAAAPQPAAPVPHLTLEPDPIPMADPFQSPEPPRAPEPPTANPVPPQQPPYGYQQPPQYAPPTYEQPQYAPPQYGASGYEAPAYGQNQQAQQPQQYNVPPVGYAQKSRLAAGLLAILLGCFGVHNFYMGFNSRGTIQLVVTLVGGLLTCGIGSIAMSIWGFIEGVQLLSGAPSRLYDGSGVIMKD